MDESTREGLVELRTELFERGPRFPKDDCDDATTEVGKRFGFKICYGEFRINGESHSHYWNESDDGYIVDLTARQFSPDVPEVFILPRDSDEARRHYKYLFDYS